MNPAADYDGCANKKHVEAVTEKNLRRSGATDITMVLLFYPHAFAEYSFLDWSIGYKHVENENRVA